jgi:hypothetical protein
MGSSCRPYVNVYNGGSTTGNHQSTTLVRTGQWNHFATTLTGTNLRFYMNGVQMVSATVSRPKNIVRNTCYLGRSNWGDSPANADVDELKIFNRSLTQSEVINDMNFNTSYIIEI